jgi:class 3 adenylate cyclase
MLLLAGLVAGALAFNGPVFGTENFLERWFIDLRFFIAAHLRTHESISDRIAIVLMDPATERTLGVPYGIVWRKFHPEVIRRLKGAGASLIVFDSMFYDLSADLDPGLSVAAAQSGNVVAGEDGTMATAKQLRDSFRAIGDLRLPPLGGKPRFVAVGPGGLPPLSVVVAALYESEAGTVRLGASPARSPGFWIDYRQPPGFFPSFSYADLAESGKERITDAATGIAYPLSVFASKIVLLGLDSGPSSHTDRFSLPNTMGAGLPGVYGHAYATETILGGGAITRASALGDAASTLLLLVVFLLILEIRVRWVRSLLLVLLPIVAFITAQALLSGASLWAGYAPLFAGFWAALLLHWVMLRFSLASSLSKAVGFDSRLIETFRRESERSGAQVRKQVTILVADVRNYTRYVASTDSAVVSRIMKEYMHAMEGCITSRGGYVNKYVGDEIVAVFGFPLESARGTERASRAYPPAGSREALLRVTAGLVQQLLVDRKPADLHRLVALRVGNHSGRPGLHGPLAIQASDPFEFTYRGIHSREMPRYTSERGFP